MIFLVLFTVVLLATAQTLALARIKSTFGWTPFWTGYLALLIFWGLVALLPASMSGAVISIFAWWVFAGTAVGGGLVGALYAAGRS